MAYILGQYNHNRDNQKDWIKLIENKYEIVTVLTKSNLENAIPFEDIGFCLKGNNASFVLGQTYYCHCKIKRLTEAQKITLKLIDFRGNDVYSDKEDIYKAKKQLFWSCFFVIPLGFEPRTHTLKVYCSTS